MEHNTHVTHVFPSDHPVFHKNNKRKFEMTLEKITEDYTKAEGQVLLWYHHMCV